MKSGEERENLRISFGWQKNSTKMKSTTNEIGKSASKKAVEQITEKYPRKRNKRSSQRRGSKRGRLTVSTVSPKAFLYPVGNLA